LRVQHSLGMTSAQNIVMFGRTLWQLNGRTVVFDRYYYYTVLVLVVSILILFVKRSLAKICSFEEDGNFAVHLGSWLGCCGEWWALILLDYSIPMFVATCPSDCLPILHSARTSRTYYYSTTEPTTIRIDHLQVIETQSGSDPTHPTITRTAATARRDRGGQGGKRIPDQLMLVQVQLQVGPTTSTQRWNPFHPKEDQVLVIAIVLIGSIKIKTTTNLRMDSFCAFPITCK
jgi:hypothetical protein